MSGSTGLEKVESIAIGAFDGMHLAHQVLFSKLGPNGAVVVIDKKNASLTPGKVRCRYVRYPCYFFSLDEIKELDAAGFLNLLRHTFPKLKKIVVGYDFAFGKDRRYHASDIAKYFDGEVEIVDEVCIDGVSVHSRHIKRLLTLGRVQEAAKLLGRYYMIEGEVVRGQGLGAKELVATINIDPDSFLLPKEGVYATLSLIEDRCYESVTFVGKRLSVDGRFSLESHILDEEIERPRFAKVLFVEYLRPNRKFATLEALKSQIRRDIEKTREVLDEKVVVGYLEFDGAPCKELYQRAHL